MTTFATCALMLLSLCAAALAEPAPPPPPPPPPAPAQFKIHFTLHDDTTQAFDVVVSSDSPCAKASKKGPGREIELRACAARDSRLDVEWYTRGPAGEYRSTSSVSLVRGATAEMGSQTGPRLTVTIQ
jgi:hypothetical protein